VAVGRSFIFKAMHEASLLGCLEDELMAYKARLLDEPRLTKATTLPDRM
jgi:hypothetical protein